MTLGTGSLTYDGSGWYYDERTFVDFGDGVANTNAAGKAWKYGLEKWCNLEGRYMHIVADLSFLLSGHMPFIDYKMHIC